MGLEGYFQIGTIITSIALTASIVLQNKGIGLGGLGGVDTATFTALVEVLKKPSLELPLD